MSSDSHYYSSYKEDRDLVLEYNQVSLEDGEPVNVLGVNIDNLTREQAVVKVIRMIENGGVNHIVPVNPYKIERMKTRQEMRNLFSGADMIIPSGAGVVWAAKKIKTPLKQRIPILSFMMDIIRIAEIKGFSIFIVGGKPETAEMAFFNIRKSFPKIRIVGRHGGYFSPEREKAVVEAMRKSEANIVFVGMGFPKENRWIEKIKGEFQNTVFVGVGGCIDIISGDIKKAPACAMATGTDWLYRTAVRPWRIGRLMRIFKFYVHAFFKGLFTRTHGK